MGQNLYFAARDAFGSWHGSYKAAVPPRCQRGRVIGAKLPNAGCAVIEESKVQKFIISGTLRHGRGVGIVVDTVWIVSAPGDPPRLVTLFPRR
jgi:hypothetical protein